MLYFTVSFALLLHVMLWGVAPAMLVTPRRWRPYWPVWIAPAGLALQSLVVWVGAHTALGGTDAYGRWSLLLPLALLIWALWRQGCASLGRLRRFAGLGVVMAGCLVLLTLPLSRISPELTTASIGSCDAADYAAGARVFKEFASQVRSGFIGLEEVVRVGSADNFFDFWLKLNHFTPSALIALNGTVLHLEPHQITGLLTMVLLVLVQPLVFWLARSVLGFGERSSLWLGFIYGISPISWYAASHVATAQLIAAAGIAMVTWCGIMLWRDRHAARAGWRYAGLLAIAYALLWGGYNFIIIVCLVPALGCVGGRAWVSGEWRAGWRWLRRMLVPLGVTGLFFYQRVAGLAERFLLFQQHDFGWKIDALMPEGWLGLVHGTGLQSWPEPTGWVLSGIVLLVLAAAWYGLVMRRGRQAWLVIAFAVPVMAGYYFLQWRGWRLGTNASYDAYKLFAVFYPVLLGAFCCWLSWLGSEGWLRKVALGMMAAITVGNLHAMQLFSARLGSGLLVVEPSLAEVQKVESWRDVASVNVLVPEFWPRLWANAFMLRTAQYFPTHSYEGRLDTPLRGDWDFVGGLVHVKLPGDDSRRINHRFSLVRNASPHFLRARLGHGWYGAEILRGRSTKRWRWNRGDAGLELENPQDRPLRVALHVTGRSLTERDLQVWIGQERLATVTLGAIRDEVTVPLIEVPPGRVTLDFRSDTPPVRPAAGDTRQLGFAVYGIVVEVLPDDAGVKSADHE